MAVGASRHLVNKLPSNLWEAQRVYNEVTKGMSCREHYHVNHESCIAGYLDMVRAACYGSSRFFVVPYLVHIIVHHKKALALDKQFYKDLLHYYARSVLAGTAVGSTYVIAACGLTRLVNGFNFWVSSLIPGIIGGFGIALEHPVRRRIDMNAVENVALQYLYGRFKLAGYLPQTRGGEAVIFMAINAMLMYLLTTSRKKPSVFWFYIPEKATTGNYDKEHKAESSCSVPHDGSCWESIMKVTQRYMIITAGLQACRLLLTGGKKTFTEPISFLRSYFSKNTASFVSLIGGYVFLFKVLRCLLAKKFGKDFPSHSAQAGLVAGAVFWLKPDTTILSSAVVALITLLYERIPEQLRPADNGMVGLIMFALSNGLLFHARCMDMKHCPDFINRLTDIGTHYRSKRIEESLLRRMVKLNLL